MTGGQDHVPARLGCSFDPNPHEEMYDGWMAHESDVLT